jgi:transposase
MYSTFTTFILQENPIMLYLGIDQHAMQLTICIRDKSGNITLQRQVSTRPDKVQAFFDDVLEQAKAGGGWVVMLEVCGFNQWLIALLKKMKCDELILIQPDKKSRRKTDRRDASRLSELLWVNRERLLAGERVQGVRRVYIPTETEADSRQVTSLRQRLGKQRTQTINRIKHILHKHNLIHRKPTKTFQTIAVRKWLRQLELTSIDKLEMNQLLDQWELLEKQIREVHTVTQQRTKQDKNAQLLTTMTGKTGYTALAIASRVGPIDRFKSARSFTNYLGLTPTCNSSGNREQLGHISKEGSPIVRFLLGQQVLHMLKRDPSLKAWYQRVKKRRGAKIARVAVMRKLASSIWYMIRHQEPYQPITQRTLSKHHNNRNKKRQAITS